MASDDKLKQLEAVAWREWEESWGNTESGAHYSGFTAGYRVVEADLTAQLAAVTAERDAAVARAERAELERDELALDKRAIRTVLAEYVGVVQGTNHPKMDGSEWEAVRELAQRGSIIKQIGVARAALAAASEGE